MEERGVEILNYQQEIKTLNASVSSFKRQMRELDSQLDEGLDFIFLSFVIFLLYLLTIFYIIEDLFDFLFCLVDNLRISNQKKDSRIDELRQIEQDIRFIRSLILS